MPEVVLPDPPPALRNALTSLVPSGRVLIRDGISPPPGTRRLTFHDAQTRETFEKFAAEFRHGAGARFTQLPGGRVELSAHDANEFLCKKDYLKNWHIEVHEEFGPFTLGEWGAVLRECGFAPLHLHEYCNGWIVENRYQGHVTITDTDDRPVPWPATNAVIVAEKPA